MKTIIATLLLLALAISTAAQRRVAYRYREIPKVQYDSCHQTSYLVANAKIKKHSGKLTIPIPGKPARVFKDDSTDTNFEEFTYLGDIKATTLSLVKFIGYNDEEIYVVNRSTGTIDTLIAEPVFAANLRDFACINNPGTDERQQVQIGEIRNGSVKTRVFLMGKVDTFLQEISCVTRSFVNAKDNRGKCWNLSFTIAGE